MNFRKVNNITGWVVCAIASLVYILTAEKSGSFWDTGEFVAAAYKVQMPHPPGAPLFVLIGRFFIILFGGGGDMAAKAVNIMNALASGFTVLFLFWSITHFARKLTTGFVQEPDNGQVFTIMGAGIIGALAYTFSDSFWYSAVEGEVYAFSSFFTALAFWAMLKWERADEAAGKDATLQARADRWIVFIFFSMGLSIGVHLLGLLTIPAIVMIYYFRRYNYTRWGAIWAFLIGCAITGLVQVMVIQWSVKIAGRFDILFVNSFGLPFFSGFIFFFLLLAALLWGGLYYANKKNLPLMRLGVWCLIFMMLGYSSYVTPLERSNANTAIDMNNVDNPMNLVYYLGRDQYGSQPIFMGPHFAAQPTGITKKTVYSKGKNPETGKGEYISYEGPSPDYEYASKDIQLFPRIWDGNDPNHANFYIQWLNMNTIAARKPAMVMGISEEGVQVMEEGQTQYTYPLSNEYAPRVQRGQVVQPGQPIAVQVPKVQNNIEWFFTYQMGFMYWRYFMWNFAGKQNDVQGFGNVRDGNWMTGISLLDNLRLGDQNKMPDSLKSSKANNDLFLLPFILGIAGCVYQFFKARKDWIITFLLFFFTGIAIVVYLNQAGGQPRERDYAFAGSYYAFAFWIGLSVVAFVRMAREVADKASLMNTLIYGSIATFVILFLSDINHSNGGTFTAALLGAILFGIVTLAITFLVRALGRTSLKTAALTATAVCALVPVIMASQEWDDHDRSQKLLAPDLAKDYLNSCPKNAILFTYGDNDTYPLWYAQEVENVRPDIRIINTSLLGIDWYVNQLRYKINESAPIDILWTEDQVRGLAYIQVEDRQPREGVFDLLDIMKNSIGKNQPKISFFPAVKTVSLPVDVAAAKANGIVTAKDSVLQQVVFDLPSGKSYYTLDQLTMLNVVAANAWKRPICFTSPDASLGFGSYLRQQGMIFQLTPTANLTRGRSMETDTTVNLLMNVFRSGNANLPGVYFDEENRRHLLSIRSAYALAASSLADEGRKQEAVNILDRAEKQISIKNMPYAMTSRNGHNQIGMLYLEAAYKAGFTDLAAKVKGALVKDFNDQLKYYSYLREFKDDYYYPLAQEEKEAQDYLNYIKQFEEQYEGKKPAQAPVQELPVRIDSADTSQRR
jgi:hypothetical protein